MATFRGSPVHKFLTGALFFGAAAVIIPPAREENIRPNVPEYVEANLENFIQQQEEALGIKYPQERPTIHYYIENDDGETYGRYRTKTDEIFLRSPYFSSEWEEADVRDTMHHELGHFFCDKLSENLREKNWPNYRSADAYEEVSLKLISEGIATYIESKMNGEEDDFNDSEWPTNLWEFYRLPFQSEVKSKFKYDGGFHLVKPIIDQHGSKGIEYLIFNTPERHEILDLPGYQQRILHELSEQNKQ